MSLIEEVMQAALVAPDDRKTEALRVLTAEGAGRNGAVEPYVTLREVSRRLGISTCSLWRYGVPSHDFAGRARFRMSEVEARLRELESGNSKLATGKRSREGAKGARGRGRGSGPQIAQMTQIGRDQG